MSVSVVEPGPRSDRLVVCDLALFYAERSGGTRTYLDEKVRFARAGNLFEHHLVVPGKRERHVVRTSPRGYTDPLLRL